MKCPGKTRSCRRGKEGEGLMVHLSTKHTPRKTCSRWASSSALMRHLRTPAPCSGQTRAQRSGTIAACLELVPVVPWSSVRSGTRPREIL